MSIYGNFALNEQNELDAINEAYQIIQEMGFSKEDLQDPKTVQKVIDNAKKSGDIANTVGIFASVLVVLEGIIFTVAPIAVIGAKNPMGGLATASIIIPTQIGITSKLLITISDYVKDYPMKKQAKDLEKLDKCCDRLIQKSEKKMTKDSKNKQKYQDIINNAKNVKKTISDYYKKIDDEKFLIAVNYEVEKYKFFVKFLNKENIDYSKNKKYAIDNIYAILDYSEIFNINEKVILERFIYYASKTQYDYDEVLEEIIEHSGIDNGKKFENYAKRDKESKWLDLNVYPLIDDEKLDYIYYNQKLSLFVFVDDTVEAQGYVYFNKSLLKGLDDRYSGRDIINKKAVIEADKILGYYKFSKAPEGITPNEFPKL
jgi:hypothetical protein